MTGRRNQLREDRVVEHRPPRIPFPGVALDLGILIIDPMVGNIPRGRAIVWSDLPAIVEVFVNPRATDDERGGDRQRDQVAGDPEKGAVLSDPPPPHSQWLHNAILRMKC